MWHKKPILIQPIGIMKSRILLSICCTTLCGMTKWRFWKEKILIRKIFAAATLKAVVSVSLFFLLFSPFLFSFFLFFFFARIGRSDLTKKLEKVGPFECDELEKHCRVSAKCYPTRVSALYTMTKEKLKSGFLLLLLVSRQTKSQVLMINNLVPIK